MVQLKNSFSVLGFERFLASTMGVLTSVFKSFKKLIQKNFDTGNPRIVKKPLSGII